MRRTVIIFDGSEEHEIGTQYFFQHPVIDRLRPSQAVEMYQSTAVFANVMEDVGELIKRGLITQVNETKTGPEYLEKVRDGLYILEGMLMDLFGDEAGRQIIESTNRSINEAG